MLYKFLYNNSTDKCFYRTIDDNYPTIKWENNIDSQTHFTCHWGQRKLFYSELEFLSIVSTKINIHKDECLIVYIGAAEGQHINLFKILFKNTQFLLYDPNEFKVLENEIEEENKQFIIKTGEEGFFTNNTVKEVLNIANGRKIILICDIRGQDYETSDKKYKEDMVWRNMLEQQKWGIMLDAEFMLLKMRFPFNLKSNDLEYNLEDELKNKIIINNNNEMNNVMYLNGKIYLQIHAGVRSAESRLFVSKIKYYENNTDYKEEQQEKYELKYYNIQKYEEQLNFFNLNDRVMIFTYEKSQDMINHLLGFDNSYDMVCEYYICSVYLKKYKKEVNDKKLHCEIIKLMHLINEFFYNISKRNESLILCVFKKYIEFYKNNKNKNGIETIKSYLVQMPKMIKENYYKQVELIKKSKILSTTEKKKQIEINKNKKTLFLSINNMNEVKFNKTEFDAFLK